MPLKRRGSVSARFSVWFSRAQRRDELRRASRRARSSPPGSSAASAASPADEVQRRAPLRARLGEEQRPGREVERRQADLAPASFAPGGLPVQPARDHQVQDEPEVALEPDGDALADAAHLADASCP